MPKPDADWCFVCPKEAADEIERLKRELEQANEKLSALHLCEPGFLDRVIRERDEARAAERERCAAFAYAKHDWPPRWIAASFRGENSAYIEFVRDHADEQSTTEKK